MLTWAMNTSVRRLHHRYQHSELFFGCLPTDTYCDRGCADDLTPVDFAAAAAVYMAVRKPADSIGKRFHLQNPATPLPLKSITRSLRTAGYVLDSITRAEFVTSKSSCDLLRRSHIPCRRSTRTAAYMLCSLHFLQGCDMQRIWNAKMQIRPAGRCKSWRQALRHSKPTSNRVVSHV